MKVSVKSATLEKYNANNRGKNVGDCVKRSMSLAFDLSYTEISKLLNAKMKELRKHAWNTKTVFETVAKELGGTSFIKNDDPTLTVEEFADNIADPNRVYLLLVGKKYGQTSHLVCIRNKTIWDSWDCREYIVTSVSTVGEHVRQKEFTDIKEHLIELQDDYAHPILFDEMEKFMHKRMMEGEVTYSHSIKAYTINTKWVLKMEPDEIISKQRIYNFSISLPFEPTMTVEDAIKFIQTTGKTRMYDRMYAIYNEEKKLVEAAKIQQKMSENAEQKSKYFETFMTDQERRFYNSLPGWAKAIIYRLRVDRPGQYFNSYEIDINKLPGDNLHPGKEQFTLEGYTADEVKGKLDHYKRTYEIDGMDYYYDY